MGDFKSNPRMPFEISVPNKIRKRIAMHKKNADFSISESVRLSQLKALFLPSVASKKKRGSMWSRFTSRINKFFK